MKLHEEGLTILVSISALEATIITLCFIHSHYMQIN